MNVTLWGTRGSIATPGPETVRYGGNTSCVEVRSDTGTRLVLDAGTGMSRLNACSEPGDGRIDLLLTHLHMDHIQGLGFFMPLFEADREVHIWGPASASLSLRERLARYLSPPLFPVRLRELPCRLTLHDVPLGCFDIGDLTVCAELICHPGPTVGYRISEGDRTLTYMPDHEPALASRSFQEHDWTSGYALAEGAEVLIHDSQYSDDEYGDHLGWGHSTVAHAVAFAREAGVRTLVTFHHDPSHTDEAIDRMLAGTCDRVDGQVALLPGVEGARIEIRRR